MDESKTSAIKSTQDMIILTNLRKQYGDFVAVENTTLNVKKGEFLTFLGSSGCGKTTTLRMIAGFEDPTEGSILIGGKHAEHLPPNKREVNTVFQNYALFPHLTIRENIAFGLKLQKVKKAEIKERVENIIKLVKLEEHADKSPDQLSGGQKQRVAIAGVIAMEPKCIVLDEPTAMLDPNGRKEVIKTVRRLQKTKKVTVILITHYMEEVIEADQVFVMDKGHVVMHGTPKEVFSQEEKLKKYRLDVPQVTMLADELRKRGLDIPKGILKKEELVEVLCRLN